MSDTDKASGRPGYNEWRTAMGADRFTESDIDRMYELELKRKNNNASATAIGRNAKGSA